jgi:hypothetical protein
MLLAAVPELERKLERELERELDLEPHLELEPELDWAELKMPQLLISPSSWLAHPTSLLPYSSFAYFSFSSYRHPHRMRRRHRHRISFCLLLVGVSLSARCSNPGHQLAFSDRDCSSLSAFTDARHSCPD